MNCIHIRSWYCDSDLCVRGTSHKPYAEIAAEAKGREAIQSNKTLSHQCYGERMTVRHASKCAVQTGQHPKTDV